MPAAQIACYMLTCLRQSGEYRLLKMHTRLDVHALQDLLIRCRLMRGNKRPFGILKDVSGVLKPVCFTVC